MALFTEASTVATDIGGRLEQARAAEGIAHCLAALGDHTTIHLRRAVDIYRDLGASETATAATHLATLESSHIVTFIPWLQIFEKR
ncbi:hypothetical protein [Nocardia sp. NPDC051570]|uniref:hypothetical protein n=1 Tax=Nocardia sp. NPDC051570 TaxID=3364324 RepID=UPI0037BC4435